MNEYIFFAGTPDYQTPEEIQRLKNQIPFYY